MVRVIRPNITADDQFFWDGFQSDKLLARRCAGCGYLQHPPTPMCPKCSSVEWKLEELSGRGTVYSWVVSHHPNAPTEAGRVVVLAELEEGIRMVANFAGLDPDAIRPGLSLELTFEDVDGLRLPHFVPAGGQA
jgi:hypothetical protein